MAYLNGKITPRVFDAVKLLLESDSPLVEVAKYMKLSPDVVGMINRAETYEEYKAMMYERGKKNRQRRAMAAKQAAEKTSEVPTPQVFQPVQEQPVQIVEHRQTVTIQATHYMHELLKEQNELLKAISAKLAFVVDELCGTSQKKAE